MCIGLNQSIIMLLYKINSKYNVLKCQNMVLLLCFFFCGIVHHNYYNGNYDVCVSIQYS